MYLQITTKCNMLCRHCCYSCNKNGKHMSLSTFYEAIAFARDQGTESISIGGGEPTLHPDFFEILKICLRDFDYVWMATNGSKTKVMRRLAYILDNNDFESFQCRCETDEEREDCRCYDNEDIILQENKLSVALSLDEYHSSIDPSIRDLWRRRAEQHRYSHFEIRTVNLVARVGRAARSGVGWGDQCVCSDFILRPDGKIRLCGCPKSPIIGTVRGGIESKWREIIDDDEGYRNTNCYRTIGAEVKED